MPNWCEGILKIRGSKENVKKFMLECLEPMQDELAILISVAKETEPPAPNETIVRYDDEDEFTIETNKGFYIKGTRRNFVDKKVIEFYHYGEDGRVLALDNFKAAWGIDSAPYLKMAIIYGVDIRIYGFERGMEFNQEIIIENGKIIKDDEIKYDDYNWECVMPHLGG